jgi:hypothetical protein
MKLLLDVGTKFRIQKLGGAYNHILRRAGAECRSCGAVRRGCKERTCRDTSAASDVAVDLVKSALSSPNEAAVK